MVERFLGNVALDNKGLFLGKWQTPNYYKPLAATVVISAASHILLILYLNQKNQTLVNEMPRAIKVEIFQIPVRKAPITEIKTVTTLAMPTTKPTVKSAIENINSARPDEGDQDSLPSAAPSTYKDLFPGPTWPSGSVVGSSTRTVTPVSSETKKLSGHLEGQLDIPLLFREKSANSKAVAKFRRTGERNWTFEYIDGEPVLRAIIFQAFKNKKNLDKITALSFELKSNEIIFVLEQVTKPALNGMKQFEDRMTFSGTRITYTRMILIGDDGTRGMPLPDEEAKRAKMRDEVALKRLMDSPAYHSPIRNRNID